MFLYSAVAKFSADVRSGCAGVANYSKQSVTKQMRENRQPVFGLKGWKHSLIRWVSRRNSISHSFQHFNCGV
jgi:hypothetical protein